MIFKDIAFYENVKVDEDELNNPIYDESIIESYPSALTQWTTEEIALLDRSVTQTKRKLLTHAPIGVLKRASHVYIDGIKYSNLDIKSDFIRWRLCHVEEFYT